MKDTNDVKDIEPGLTIRAIGTTQPDGSFLWGGVMFGPSGQEFGAVTGRLPREIIQTREARRRGRPKDEKKKVSLT